MKVILFPTDFSDLAQNAFLYALHLAKHIRAKIYVLHCYEKPVLSSTHGGQPEAINQVYQSIELSRFETFKKKIPDLRKSAEENGYDAGEMIFLFEEGSVNHVVKDIVKKEKIHVIVMGTHGHSGFFDRVIGSNTANVIKSVHTPVLAVPPHARFNGINKVVFTTLFREVDKKALREALIMANEVNATIECVHVNTGKFTGINVEIERWKEEFAQYNVTFRVLEKVESVENTITHYILENNVDMLAVIKRNRGFFERLFKESTTNHLAFHTKVPIIVYHEE